MNGAKKYRINEIFYSLQGEGRWAGCAAVFIRFAGCNLKCPFCDTDFHTYKEMTAGEIRDEVNKLASSGIVVFTGGEPSLQLDYNLTYYLNNYYKAVETNGTNIIPVDIQWVTFSPKGQWQDKKVQIKKVDEVKVVMDEDTKDEELLEWSDNFPNSLYYVQPCDTGDAERNKIIMNRCVEFVKAHPLWRLSLQQQKILNIR